MATLVSFVSVIFLLLGSLPPTVLAQDCPGDRDGSGDVTVDEIVATVDSALNGCAAANDARFADVGDGTIRDSFTGRLWEKKTGLDVAVDPSDLHDANNVYRWAGICSGGTTRCQPTAEAEGLCLAAVEGGGDACLRCEVGTCEVGAPGVTVWQWLAELNRTRFAGYDDWRLPSRDELETLADRDKPAPSVVAPFHGTQCGAGCDDLSNTACACTLSEPYWSTTTLVSNLNRAWAVQFSSGGLEHINKSNANAVRAVR